MPKLLTAAVASSILVFWGLSSQAQTRLPPPSVPPPLPNVSSPPTSGGVERSLGFGDFGSDVELLQRALRSNGIDPGPIDGDYGSLTREAVREFQQVYDLPVTGIADEATLNGLGVALGEELSDDFPYVAAITEPPRNLGEVQRVFGNAVIDSARQGKFINIGRYSSRSAASERVREARRSGFDARILYQR